MKRAPKENPPPRQIVPHSLRITPVGELVPHERNARKHADSAIDESIAANGFYKPVVASTASGKILAGHGTFERAKAAGLTKLPVYWLDGLTPAQEIKILLGDNRTSDLGSYDEVALADVLQSVQSDSGSFAGTGYDLEAYDALIEKAAQAIIDEAAERAAALRAGPAVEPTDIDGEHEDDIPDVPVVPVTMAGDLWILGDHRVLCGDSTKAEAVEKLMAGKKAHLVFTDPPYGVSYDGGTTVREKLAVDDTTALYGPACEMAATFSDETAALYLWHAGVKGIAAAAAAAAAAAGYQIRCEIVWNKNLAQFGALSAQYKQKHEPAYYCHRRGTAPRWFGPTNEVTVWDCDRATKNEYHPTQKPIALAARAIGNSSKASNIVLDLFGGSGSTLIACEKLGRRGRLVEIDPKYVDVIVTRWQDLTKKLAGLEGDGRTFDEVAEERLKAAA